MSIFACKYFYKSDNSLTSFVQKVLPGFKGGNSYIFCEFFVDPGLALSDLEFLIGLPWLGVSSNRPGIVIFWLGATTVS